MASLDAAVAGASSGGGSLPQGSPLTGVVKAWYDDKGFGFLMPDGGGPDVFCHRNQLTDGTSPETGTQVTFEVRLNPSRGKYEATSCQGAGVLPAAKTALESLGVTSGIGGNKQVSDNLFVAGLPTDFSEERVRGLFSQYGVVKQCKVLPANGKPDTAALIRMADLAHSQWMVDNLHGTTPQGLPAPISVRYADNRAEKAKALSIVMGSPPPSSYGAVPAGGLAGSRFSPYGSLEGADALLPITDTAAWTAAALGAAQAPAQVPVQSADAGLGVAALIAALAPSLAQLGVGAGLQTQDLQNLVQGLQGLQNTLVAGSLGSVASAGAPAALPAGAPSAAGLAGLGGITSGGALAGTLPATDLTSLGAFASAGVPVVNGLSGVGALGSAGTPAGALTGLEALVSASAPAGAPAGTAMSAGAPALAGLASAGAPAGTPATLPIVDSAAGSLGGGPLVGGAAALGDALAAALAGTGVTMP